MSCSFEDKLTEYADNCINCGVCTQTNCGNFPEGTPDLGTLCEEYLAENDEHFSFAFSCALCNRCTISCPMNLKASDAISPARKVLMKRYPQLKDNYRNYRPDMRYNLFTLMCNMRSGQMDAVNRISGEADLSDEANSTAFFPGCSLFAYAPKLTEATFAWLREQDIAARLVTVCCGSILNDTGFDEEYTKYRASLVAFLEGQGIKHIVLVCPHCKHTLEQVLEGTDIDLASVSSYMVDRGMSIPGEQSVSIHDSCYDRETGEFGHNVRTLLANHEIKPMEHDSTKSMCCGGGGMVSCYARDFCEYRRTMRLQELDDAHADECVSTCFSCVNSMQHSIGFTPVRHYLELALGVDVDWNEVYTEVDRMYSNPEAQKLLATDTLLFE